MILKFVAPIVLFIIAILQGIFSAQINEKRWLKFTLVGLLLTSLIIGFFILIIDDNNSKEISRQQKNNIDSLRIENSLLNNKLDSLHKMINPMNQKVSELNEKLEPFVKIALNKYPTYDVQFALNKLTQDIENTKRLAEPPTLILSGKEISRDSKGITLLLQFESSKNQTLGLIEFSVEIDNNSTSKILEFWPSTKGGAFSSGKDSKKISPDGKTARLIYSLIGAGNPTFELKVSKAAFVRITGNYLSKPVIIKIE